MNPIIYAGLPIARQILVRKDKELYHKGNIYNDQLETILDEVCKYMEVNVSDVKSKNRMLLTKTARFYYIYLSKMLTENSLDAIGKVVYRHHATVIHGNNTVKDWLTYDKQVIKQLEDIETNIENKSHDKRRN